MLYESSTVIDANIRSMGTRMSSPFTQLLMKGGMNTKTGTNKDYDIDSGDEDHDENEDNGDRDNDDGDYEMRMTAGMKIMMKMRVTMIRTMMTETME